MRVPKKSGDFSIPTFLPLPSRFSSYALAEEHKETFVFLPSHSRTILMCISTMRPCPSNVEFLLRGEGIQWCKVSLALPVVLCFWARTGHRASVADIDATDPVGTLSTKITKAKITILCGSRSRTKNIETFDPTRDWFLLLFFFLGGRLWRGGCP